MYAFMCFHDGISVSVSRRERRRTAAARAFSGRTQSRLTTSLFGRLLQHNKNSRICVCVFVRKCKIWWGHRGILLKCHKVKSLQKNVYLSDAGNQLTHSSNELFRQTNSLSTLKVNVWHYLLVKSCFVYG